jgi:hypothetical protein
MVRAAARLLGMRPGVVIAYLPTWHAVVGLFPAARRIYHCVDAYGENPGVDRDRINELEGRLLRMVDTVWAVSPPLRERLARLHPNVRLLQNVADVERFSAAAGQEIRAQIDPTPQIVTSQSRPRSISS